MIEDTPNQDTPADEPAAEEEQLAPYLIEAARSSRSKCRTCRRKIDKDTLRIGVLLEGPYGTGYLWHHLTCAARRRFEDVEAAYEQHAWAEGVEVPPLEKLAKLREEAEQKKAERKEAPYVQRAPTGRAKCKHCGELIPQDALRVTLLREATFGNQVRSAPINVHASCVAAELRAEDCLTELDGFEQLLRANSTDVDAPTIDAALAEIGPLE